MIGVWTKKLLGPEPKLQTITQIQTSPTHTSSQPGQSKNTFSATHQSQFTTPKQNTKKHEQRGQEQTRFNTPLSQIHVSNKKSKRKKKESSQGSSVHRIIIEIKIIRGSLLNVESRDQGEKRNSSACSDTVAQVTNSFDLLLLFICFDILLLCVFYYSVMRALCVMCLLILGEDWYNREGYMVLRNVE